MGVIVGAAGQPLQPPEQSPAGDAIAVDSARLDQTAPAAGFETGTGMTLADGIRLPDPTATIGSAARVALLLPLSGRQQALGIAVRDGFLAAHLAAPADRRCEILLFDEARLGATEAYRLAADAGAGLIVGPLLRESVQALTPVAGTIPVLALNFLADTDPVPPAFWQFGLSPEDEAREIAVRAMALDQRRAIALAPDNDWGQRLQNAFTAEYTALGGQVLAARFYAPGEADFTTLIQGLLLTEEGRNRQKRLVANLGQPLEFEPRPRQDIDLIFLAATSAAGKQIAPQLRFFGAGDIPTYSTSAIWEDGGNDAADLSGIMFPDSPWVLTPDARATAVKSSLVRHWGRRSLGVSRLYALGYDAYELLPVIRGQSAPGTFNGGEIAGVTGLLAADLGGRIHRRLVWATIRDGRPLPLPAASPEAQPLAP